MKALVIGGAGYIGGITAHTLIQAGHEVVILDNLSTGHALNVPEAATFIEGSMDDTALLASTFSDHEIDVVLHFAAKIRVDESMDNPMLYYENNSIAALKVMNAAAKARIKNYIFSSTATVYGISDDPQMSENTTLEPANPYAISKLVSEQFLRSFGITHGMNYLALRYFNAAGAAFGIGPDYPFRSHLVPILVDKYLANDPLTINGDDYDTEDGTAVRDYVHVADIARAHVIAAEKMVAGQDFKTAINLGTGTGTSIKEVVVAMNSVVDGEVATQIGPRRTGDTAAYYAVTAKARELLEWTAEKSLKDILRDALEWQIAKNATKAKTS